MSINKKRFLALIVLIFSLNFSFSSIDFGAELEDFRPTVSQDSNSNLSNDKTNSPSYFSSDNLFQPQDEIAPIEEPLTGEECVEAQTILDFITPPNSPDDNEPFINLPRILQENLYKKTTGPVTRRSLLDEPTLRPYIFDNDCWTFAFQPFYNYSPEVFFTKCSPFISSYIDLNNQNIINEIEEALERNEFGNVDIPGILGLFSELKLQQHRSGIMFSFLKNHKDFNFMFRIPIYYLIEHFFLTPLEKERIENSPFFLSDDAGVGLTPQDEVDRFTFRHLVVDRVGLGDSRLNVLYKLYNNPCSKVWLGLFVTIPSAEPFKIGLLGRDFSECLPSANFNIKRLFNLYLCAPEQDGGQREANRTIQKEGTEFLVGALDRLSANLLDTPLGNGGHWGFGPQAEFRQQVTDYISTYGYLTLEWFNTSAETRFFLLKKNPQEFDRNYRDPENSEKNLTFLNNQVIATLYTIPVCTNITPGMITNFRYAFMYDTARWHSLVGFDYWRQGCEKIRGFKNNDPCEIYDIKKAIRPKAQQGKIYFSFGYYSKPECHHFAWHVLLTGSGSVFNSGIGAEYGLAVRAGLEF